jgi:hypothetical protein
LVETDELSEESWTSKFPWEHLKRDFTGWHPDIQTIIDKADKNNCFRWSLYYRPAIENWSSQHVTMLGDAVHATLPYLAQGAESRPGVRFNESWYYIERRRLAPTIPQQRIAELFDELARY